MECNELQLSAPFIDFLSYYFGDHEFPEELWPDQISEIGSSNREMRARADARLQRLLTDERTSCVLDRLVEWIEELSTGQGSLVSELHEMTTFIAVVGIPRTGGSYLTAEILSSLGHNPSNVPASIAHDGFPDIRQPAFEKGRSQWHKTIQSVSEYLVLIELFFKVRDARSVVPKKFTKAVHSGLFIKGLLGPAAEYLITVRDPISCCISTYEKSGGFPERDNYRPRSTIEKWMARESYQVVANLTSPTMDRYIDHYISYWEIFYTKMALSGLIDRENHQFVVFGKRNMESVSEHFHRRFASGLDPSKFQESTLGVIRHPSFVERAETAIKAVGTAWTGVGLQFPCDALLKALHP